MVKFWRGNILESNADVHVIPVNCGGVMGAGLARAYRNRFPRVEGAYLGLCADGVLRPGVVKWAGAYDKTFVFFPTKDEWRNSSQLAWIQEGLLELTVALIEGKLRKAKHVAIPALGCGLGGLEWQPVRRELEWHADRVCEFRPASRPCRIDLYLPR